MSLCNNIFQSLFSIEIKEHCDISDMSIEKRFPVLISEAVLTFIDSTQAKHVLFKNAMVTEEALQIFGSRISLQAAGIGDMTLTIEDLKSSDQGKYEVRDKNNHLVSVMYVKGGSGEWLLSYEFKLKGHIYFHNLSLA